MKKIKYLFLVLVVSLFLSPYAVMAKDGNPVPETFAETAADIDIDFDHSNYKADDSKPNIYLFRGKTCGYCHNLLSFLESIVDDYGKYFNLVSYEVWYDTDNSNLMKQVADVFGDDANGVPYLIIGDKTFIGYYAATDDEQIKAAIKDLYDTKKENRYDVMDHLGEKYGDTATTNNAKASADTKVVAYLIVIFSFLIVAVYYVKSNADKKYLEERINELVNELKEFETKVNKKSDTKEKTTTKKTKKSN